MSVKESFMCTCGAHGFILAWDDDDDILYVGQYNYNKIDKKKCSDFTFDKETALALARAITAEVGGEGEAKVTTGFKA